MDVVNIYTTTTGAHTGVLPVTSWRWSSKISGAGSLSFTIPLIRELDGRNLRSELEPWKNMLAVVDNKTRRVIAAGIVYQRSWDADKQVLTISCEDIWGMLKRRLVLPDAAHTFTSGQVQTKTDNYPAQWKITFNGSLADIAVQLVQQTMRQGQLPITLPPLTGGSHTRTYLGTDLGTVEDRVTNLTEVLEGPEIIFDPRLDDNSTSLSWHMLTGSPELVINTHQWDIRNRAIPLINLSIQEDTADMTGDSWGRGGSQNDQTLLAHCYDSWLESRGWPLLQGADTSHSSVSVASTLMAYTQAVTVQRAKSTEVVNLKARRTDQTGYPLADALMPGDHIILRHTDPYIGAGKINLKVLQLSGSDDEWVTASCREII